MRLPYPDGRSVSHEALLQDPTPGADANALIVATALTKTYLTPGGVEVRALVGVDLTVNRGEVVALVGPSGSGKSTLLHLLGGMDTPDSGRIVFDGRGMGNLSRAERVVLRRSVGFVFQSFALLPALTARDNVMLPTLPFKVEFDTKQRATELLATVGLAGREDALPSQLSGGQRQRVAIARALMNHPRLVIADEPTGNLDTATGAEILGLLLRLRDERGLTIVLATHDETVATRCDRIVHVRDGLLADQSTPPGRQLDPLDPSEQA